MATQMHVAFSSLFKGVGMIGGSPYYCAQYDEIIATTDCMDTYQNINTSALAAYTASFASSGLVDGTGNMTGDRVFILSGINDTTVRQGVAKKVQKYYEKFVDSANIKTVFDLKAGHTFPTVNYGNPCAKTAEPWIGRCNYDAAYEILNHIYGNLTRPSESTALKGDFYQFEQGEFFPASSPEDSSMGDLGFVYVPSGCISGNNTCKLHMALHGCLQGKYLLKDKFARHTGYNEVGELNNIIIIFPQATAIIDNPLGCWDWWGYTVKFYPTKVANQPLAMWRMIKKAASF